MTWHYLCNMHCTSATVETVDCQKACLHDLHGSGEEGVLIRCHVVGAPGPVHVQGCLFLLC